MQGLGTSAATEATGKQQQAQGTQALTNATDYWNRQLAPGRTATTQLAAPALNEAMAGGDATRAQQAQFGTGRSGGTAGGNQQAATKTQSDIDNIINENLVGGRKEAAAGLANVGGTELSAGSDSIRNALAQLGLGTDAEKSVLGSAQADRAGVREAQTAIWSKIIGALL